MGELLTIWSVRLAVGCYLGRYLADAGIAPGDRRRQLTRCLWTAGCALYLAHVVCAFAFFHNWSHGHAYEHTAAQTMEVVGWNWGGGLHFNYLFTVVWTADAVRQWSRDAASKQTNRVIVWSAHLFLAFIVVNATVVFGPPFWKWLAAAYALLIAAAAGRRRRYP